MTVSAQLASSHVPVLHLAELAFASGTLRFTTWSHSLVWAGYTWLGLNAVTSVSPVKVSDRPEYPAMDLGLQVADNAVLALALGAPGDYRGKAALVYQCYLDDEFKPLEEPELVWAGVMSQVRLNTGNGEEEPGSLVLRCEQPGRDARGPKSLRLNDAQHQARWPGDTMLSRIEALSGKPVPWLSTRFQRV